jgi:hypothetical protein
MMFLPTALDVNETQPKGEDVELRHGLQPIAEQAAYRFDVPEAGTPPDN